MPTSPSHTLRPFRMDEKTGHADSCAFPDIDDTIENFQQRPTVDKDFMTSHDEHDLFDDVSHKLKRIGAIPFKSFIHGEISVFAGYGSFNRTHLQNPGGLFDPSSSSRFGKSISTLLRPVSPPCEGQTFPSGKLEPAIPRDNAISRLHQTSVRTFGTADVLKYEFLEENGQKSKQCILTIARPEGLTRSYKSEPIYLRRADAKAKAATVAVQMGALDFILTGDSDDLKARKGTLLTSSSMTSVEVGRAMEILGYDSAALKIENCLKEWRRSEIQAEWIFYNDPKLIGRYGAALRIQITPGSLRIYSCDSIYCSEAEAKAVVVREALDDGILDYIKHGNGQTSPFSCLEGEEPGLVGQLPYQFRGNRTLSISLQSFYETLPQPLPEPFGDQTAEEINAPSYFNALLQSARGTKIKHSFYWILDKCTGLFGCLLRLERGKETKTYFADRLFQKRNEAKAAACLLAFSQGIGDYIRSQKLALDSKLTTEMKRLASEKLIFALNTECSRIHAQSRLNFSYSEELDAFGCTLEINISPDAGCPDVRRWTVAPEYRSKNDAKLAVCYCAVEQGAIEMMQFRGLPPPIDYVPYWDRIHGRGKAPRVTKRKSVEDEASTGSHALRRKRRKSGTQIERQNLHSESGGEGVGISEPSTLFSAPGMNGESTQSMKSFKTSTRFNNHSMDGSGRKSNFDECNDGTSTIQTPLSSLESTAYESPAQPDSYYSSTGVYPIPSDAFHSSTSVFYPAASAESMDRQMHCHRLMNGTSLVGHPSMYFHAYSGIFGPPAHMSYHGAPYHVYPPMAYPPLPPIYAPPSVEGTTANAIQGMRSSVPPVETTDSEPPSVPRPPKVKRIDRSGTLPQIAKAEPSDPADGDKHSVETETEPKSGKRIQVLERRASIP